MRTKSGEARQFFEDNVRKGGDVCIEWPFRCNPNGYGTWTKTKNVTWLVHRLAFTTVHGPIPDKMLVCHTCDNRKCFNVNHLFLGTDLDNCWDKIKKGRQANFAGESHPRASLLETDVVRILSHPSKSPAQISRETGVSRDIIKNILYGKSWKNVSLRFYRDADEQPHPAWLAAISHDLLLA